MIRRCLRVLADALWPRPDVTGIQPAAIHYFESVRGER